MYMGNQQSVEVSAEMQERMDEINNLLSTPIIEPNTALIILINAVDASFNKEGVYNDLDKALIAKALSCFKSKADLNEDILIKVK